VRGMSFAGTLLALVGAAALLRAEERVPSAGTPQRVDALVRQLGDARFAVREKAQRELEAIGSDALESLRKAARSEDQETSRRASEAVQKIDAALLSTRLLAPKTVKLNLKDMPILSAVAELQRQSGYVIYVPPGSRTTLARRRVALATGNVCFWEAFDALCLKGRLEEEALNSPATTVSVGLQGGQKSPIVVTEGDRTATPTCYAGAVRIRVLPATEGNTRNRSWAADETLIFLEVAAEPRLRRFMLSPGLSLRQARDDQGQTLALVSDDIRTEVGVPADAGGKQVLIARLKLGRKPARALKALDGAITARALTPPEPVVEVENILKAAGQTVKGKRGGSLEVVAVERNEPGTIQVQVRMTNLATDNPLANLFPMGVGGRAARVQQVVIQGQKVQIQMGGPGRGMRRRVEGGDFDSPLPSLVDARGAALPLAQVAQRQLQSTTAGLVEDATLVFRPLPGQGDPVRLVLHGQHLATVPIAFHLTDVPLQ
jgi:hypothetical protein